MTSAWAGAVAQALRPLVRLFRTVDPAPGLLRRMLLFAGFFVTFGLWMAHRALLLMSGRRAEVTIAADLGGDGERFTLRCTLPDMIQMYLFLFGVWEPDLNEYIRRSLRDGDGFVDVGANVGAFTIMAASRVGSRGSVVAIDASAEMLARLRENIALNPALADGRLRVVHAAVAEEHGELDLYRGPAKNLGRTTTLREIGDAFGAAPCERVAAAPLGALLSDEEVLATKLIKIDVEGAEAGVLRGMLALLPRLRPDAEIIVELSPHWWGESERPLDELLAPFLEAGYRCFELPNNYWPWRYIWPRWIQPPRLLREPLSTIARRVDLVLSRSPGETL